MNPPRFVLFVCSGNTCRSPMAARIFAHRAGLRGWSGEATSAGLYAGFGAPASRGAVAAMQRRGLSLDDHRSRPLDEGLVARADLILTMDRDQKGQILVRWPEAGGKVFTLAEYAGEAGEGESADVRDPFGGGPEEYEGCAARLEALVERAVARMLGPDGSGGGGTR